MIENEFDINLFRTIAYTSCTNGQVERFHSILQEIMRCIKYEGACRSLQELLDKSAKEYNFSVIVISKQPIEIFFGKKVSNDTSLLARDWEETIRKILEKQRKGSKGIRRGR